jgi:hypothetical protein
VLRLHPVIPDGNRQFARREPQIALEGFPESHAVDQGSGPDIRLHRGLVVELVKQLGRGLLARIAALEEQRTVHEIFLLRDV